MKLFKYLVVAFVLMQVVSCKQEKRYHELANKVPVNQEGNAIQGILDFQAKMNADFRNPETSPLPDRYRKDFEKLDFFPPDTQYIVKAKFIRTPEALPFLMPSTTGDASEEVVFGTAHFYLNGKEHRLEVYQSKELMLQEEFKDYLFLPFTDETNGKQTYTGGRYLDLVIPSGDSIIIDFNRAYNPYCAYNKKYSCPIVPSANALDTEIMAGTKAFEKQ